MIYLWMFLALCIVCVSGYIGQVLNVVSAVSSFFGMVILSLFKFSIGISFFLR